MAKCLIVLTLVIFSQMRASESFPSPGQLGSQTYPASSCDAIAKARPCALDGIYYLYNEKVCASPFPVYCYFSSSRGYTMVYKVVSKVRGRAADMWINEGTVNEGELRVLSPNNDFKAHYKNAIVDNWESFAPTEVKVVLFNGGQEMARFVFNALESNNTSWFAEENLISSPYTDISSPNYFSILGDQQQRNSDNVERNFFISSSYAGCPEDYGWLVVISAADPCGWATSRGDFITILYGSRTTMTNWNAGRKRSGAFYFISI
jgi:hypothetical protein